MEISPTCIVRPVGCGLQVEEQNGKTLSISGNRCPENHGYALQGMTVPVRSVTAFIRIKGGKLPLVGVRLSAPIPKKNIFGVMEEIRKVTIHAPVHIGDVAVRRLLGTEMDVMVTKSVLEAWHPDGPMLAIKGGQIKNIKVTEGGMVSGSLQDTKIPRMSRVRQTFPREVILRREIAGVMDQQLSQKRLASLIKPGIRIAVMIGSRGIRNTDIITKAIVDFVKGRGVVPFTVPTVGSHGSAAVGGQLEVLAGYDITPETTGCPTRSSMETVEPGVSERGRWVLIDRNVYETGGIIISCRLRPHNALRGTYESGPYRMMTVGLGEQEGASITYGNGVDMIVESIPTMVRVMLKKTKILLAIPCMENAYDETRRIEAILAQDITEREPEFPKYAFSSMPKLMAGETDVLVVDEVGKNCSDTGVDPDITGISSTPYATDGIRVQRTCSLSPSQASHGDALGCGLASTIIKKIFDQMDIEEMYPSCTANTVLALAWIPCVAVIDREALQLCIRIYNKIDRGRVRVVRIVNSLHIGEIVLSEAYYEGVEKGLYLGVGALGKPKVLELDESGNLTIPAEYMTTS